MSIPRLKPEPQEDETLPPLSDSGRAMLVWVANHLRRGFTGRLEIECRGGGVRGIQLVQHYEPQRNDIVLRGGRDE